MTIVLMLLAGYTAYKIGYHYGYKQGERDMYGRCRRADEAARGFFSNVSKL